MTKTSLIEFPCDFPIKIMGLNTPTFLQEIRKIIHTHFPNIEEEKISHKKSNGANYL